MDNLLRDVSRLNLISQMYVGQERFSPVTYFTDFTHYYFSRFLVNLTHAFKDFTSSEIKDFNRRNHDKLTTFVKYPALRMDKTIVPIPRGMVNSYKATLDSLLSILESISVTTIESDLNQILSAMGTGKLKLLSIASFDQKSFEEAKSTIAKLFGKTGLTHSTASCVLVSPTDIGYVNDKLLASTNTLYPTVLSLNPILKKVESRFHQLKFSDQDKEALSGLLMTMAYRLSIMATVADHLQSLEHGFVASLNQVLKNT